MKVSNSSEKAGLPPGSFVYVGDTNPEHDIKIDIMEYNSKEFIQSSPPDLAECVSCKTNDYISWINLDGVHDIHLLKSLGEDFKIHPLVIEDILNTKQRPKAEISDDYIYVTLKMIVYSEEKESFEREQISILLVNDLIITIQQYPGDVFDGVRNRIKKSKGKIRKLGADYLLYALLDSVIDGYFKVAEQLDLELEEIEDNLEHNKNIVPDVHWLKKELLYIRRATSPVRDIISTLMRDETPLIKEKTIVYFKDAYDHCIQVYETVELVRDIVSGLIEVHLSSISNKMNEVMKYLTVFASIFIPLTFVTGIYGMNFEYMPELKWKYGYFILLGTLVVIGGSLSWLFKKKEWL